MNENIILHIQAKLLKLPKAEKKIGAYILEHAVETVTCNTNELAQKAGVSAATVIRFCRSIGLTGFSQLKIQLYADASEVDSDLYTDITPNEDVGVIAEKLALRFNQSITQTTNHLDREVIESASSLIRQSAGVYVYGLGASHIVAEDFAQKFSRIGKSVIHMLDHHLMSSLIINAEEPQLFVAVSNSGETNEVIKLTEIANKRGFDTIGISQHEESTLAQLANFPLIHHGGEEVMLRSAATTSLMSQLFMIDVLYFAYVSQNSDHVLDMLKESKINIQAFFHNEDD
ncbi:MurR/RpiR family transcriptional regulator [Barrientosiimonas marina]|uniref:MurR/RpiR family transcriptional regulator n=1 Tax=Lentibacillus kimchii TaxID=1542911 RepID=A0ABW2UX20_9BACI